MDKTDKVNVQGMRVDRTPTDNPKRKRDAIAFAALT